MRKDRIYPAALVLIFAALALVRRDLAIGALDAALTELGSGWASAAWIVFEGLLLGSILLMTLRAIARDPDPLLDALVVSSACVYGYLAELAGTTLGLWTYYTGEKPPLWIVPAWPLGALVVTRLSGRVSALYERIMGEGSAERRYLTWILLFYAVFIPFTAPRLSTSQSALAAMAAAAVFFAGTDRRRDFAILFTGTACVFWADLWGTTNHCWTYHTGAGTAGTAAGILFGMMFDSLVVLAAVRTGEALRRLAARSPER